VIVTELAAHVLDVAWEREPALSVVIACVGRRGAEDTVASVVDSAHAADVAVDVRLLWQGAGAAPELNGHAVVTRVFPAGLAYARNRGLEDALAPVVAFVDDDEVVDRGWVGSLLRTFDSVDTVAVFGPIAPRDERGLAYCSYDNGGELRVLRGGYTLPWTVGTGGNMAFRREELLAAGGFDVLFGAGSVARAAEDTELILRLLRAGHAVAWSPEVVVYHPTKTAAERLAARFPYGYGIGKLARRHNDPLLAARYARSIVDATGRALATRDGRRLREVRETLRGFASGVAFRAKPVSPASALERAPEAVAELIRGERVRQLPPLYRPDPHYLYRVGEDRLLHVYLDPKQRLRDGFAVRERIRQTATVGGIARLHAMADSDDAVWVLEDWLAGSAPKPARVREWFGRTAAWALELGGQGGPPVEQGSWWADEAEAAVEVAPPELRPAVTAALAEIGRLPSRRLHGDFQRKNLVLDHGRLGVVDWERAYLDGPPGFDLLFLAVMARSDVPDRELVRMVASGREPDFAALRPLLARAGVEGVDLRRWLLAALAVWAADERVRVLAPGAPTGRARYLELLLELGPELA
jgi:GT2 family glycosyltransferase